MKIGMRYIFDILIYLFLIFYKKTKTKKSIILQNGWLGSDFYEEHSEL